MSLIVVVREGGARVKRGGSSDIRGQKSSHSVQACKQMKVALIMVPFMGEVLLCFFNFVSPALVWRRNQQVQAQVQFLVQILSVE